VSINTFFIKEKAMLKKMILVLCGMMPDGGITVPQTTATRTLWCSWTMGPIKLEL
jgi:hypothetical protein